MPKTDRTKLVCALLALITLVVYWPVNGFDFTNYDDPDYVIYNTAIQHGLNKSSLTWALKSSYASNWHPLTWVSHIVDCSVYGLKPGGHHVTNLLFHTANVVLLFLVLQQLTGVFWRSALVAALFAWHPLHVESVAWVSERKDVLSTFFWLLTMSAYACYARPSKHDDPTASDAKGSKAFYVLALGLFTLGLLSKPMVVTLPCVLLLLDFWPLKRPVPLPKLLLEKVPFFALALLDCFATFHAQAGSNSVVTGAVLSPSARISNALVSYVLYLWKTLWPVDLAIPYPYSQEWTLAQTTGAALLLAAISAVVVWRWRRQPYLAVGWLWFLGTLVPVIGLVQVGMQFMADRYTYVPLIGVFMMLAWSIPADWLRWPRPGLVFGVVTGAVLMLLVMSTSVQLLYWRNSVTLFTHATQVTSNSILAEYNLAAGLEAQGHDDQAIVHYQKALAIRPNRVEAQFNSQPQAHYNLGLIFRKQQRWAEAETEFRACLQNDPKLGGARSNLGRALLGLGRVDDAVKEFRTLVQDEPSNASAKQNLAAALARQGDITEAQSQYREAVLLNPDGLEPLNALAWSLATQPNAEFRNAPEAVRLAEHASDLSGRRDPRILGTLDAAYAEAGRFDEAIATALKVRELALAQDRKDLAEAAAKRLELYRAGKPYRE